jgi:hypothetical protein
VDGIVIVPIVTFSRHIWSFKCRQYFQMSNGMMDVDDDEWDEVCAIHATVEQEALLDGTMSLRSLRVADFLGRQSYIDKWIEMWLSSDKWQSDELPLCIKESLICDKKLWDKYQLSVTEAILRNDIDWMRVHCIIQPARIWSIVEFNELSDELFHYLWEMEPVPLDLGVFMAHDRHFVKWKKFVDWHGPTASAEDAAQQQWFEGLRYCIEEGAENLEELLPHCIRSAALFGLLTLYNPKATVAGWEQFQLQKRLKRVEDVLMVEEWFWCNGFQNAVTNLEEVWY